MASKWILRLGLAALVVFCAYWLYTTRAPQNETRYAFASDHPFLDPVVFFGGKGLRFDKDAHDSRLLRVTTPPQDLSKPPYLLVEDGEFDYLGFVKKDQFFIPLQLFQIHDARLGRSTAPVSDCKTYLEIQATADTILVMVDEKYVLHGTKVSPNLYSIPFCETTREHQFRALGQQGALAMKGTAPATYAFAGMGNASYQLRYPGDTIRMGPGAYSPMTYSTPTMTQAEMLKGQSKTTETTKVILSLQRQVQSPWVFLNDKRLKDFTLNAARNQVTFTVPKNNKLIKVRVGDSNCECQASGYPRASTLELAGYCECRDIQVTVQLDPGLDRYRNKIRIYVDGELSDLTLPPAGKPLAFPVRKSDRDQQVEIKMLMVDDSGHAGLIDLCRFSVPSEVTTSNLNPACHCTDCPPNIKISG